MAVPITIITVTMPRDPALFTRDHNRFARAANVAAARYHFDKHISRHFEDFAGAKYGYWKRTKGYLKRKKKIVGNKPDMVFSGKTKRMVLSSEPTIRATPKGSTLILRLPIAGGTGKVLDADAAARLFAAGKRKNKGFTQRQVNSQVQIQRRVKELQAVSPDEVRKLMQVRADEYTRLANEPGVRRRIRIRGQ